MPVPVRDIDEVIHKSVAVSADDEVNVARLRYERLVIVIPEMGQEYNHIAFLIEMQMVGPSVGHLHIVQLLETG